MEWHILKAENSEDWSNILCCDVPLIYSDQDDLMRFSGPIIFPLSNSQILFIRPRSESNPFGDPVVITKIAMLMYLQAMRYVASSNRSYLEQIIDMSEQYVGVADVSRLQREVFAHLA